MTRTSLRWAVVATAVVALSACQDQLVVENPNSGNTDKVLATPADAENLLGSYYKRWHSGVYGSISTMESMMNIFAFQTYGSLANECMNSHAPFTGAGFTNNPGNTCQANKYRLYSIGSEVNRVASSFLAEFLNGLSLGYIAMVYDSAGIVGAGTDPEDAGPLYPHTVVRDSALAAFDRAIAAAQNPLSGGANGFPLPATWIPSPTTFTSAEFVKLVRAYRARIRANVPRTPEERAAVDWAAIIADADGGLTATHQIVTNTVTGPTMNWRQQYSTFGLWHQMTPFIIGMADTSGSYASWIAAPVGNRATAGGNPFGMATPDRRFPQGATRAAQQADFAIARDCSTAGTACPRYFVNRPTTQDQTTGEGWGLSQFDFVRFYGWNIAGDAGQARNGRTPLYTIEELQLLKAEGLYRAGNYAAAGAIVNTTRVRNGLAAITAFDATTPVPGGNACVPKVPQAPTFNTVGCGTLWDALKYEKRIETAYTHFAPWYLDSRGWGDLPETTPLFVATPYQDIQARGKPSSAIYGTGVGVGNAPNSTAARSSYGW
jgi:hypothetical protein